MTNTGMATASRMRRGWGSTPVCVRRGMSVVGSCNPNYRARCSCRDEIVHGRGYKECAFARRGADVRGDDRG